jgi:hypothetical protein
MLRLYYCIIYRQHNLHSNPFRLIQLSFSISHSITSYSKKKITRHRLTKTTYRGTQPLCGESGRTRSRITRLVFELSSFFLLCCTDNDMYNTILSNARTSWRSNGGIHGAVGGVFQVRTENATYTTACRTISSAPLIIAWHILCT